MNRENLEAAGLERLNADPLVERAWLGTPSYPEALVWHAKARDVDGVISIMLVAKEIERETDEIRLAAVNQQIDFGLHEMAEGRAADLVEGGQ